MRSKLGENKKNGAWWERKRRELIKGVGMLGKRNKNKKEAKEKKPKENWTQGKRREPSEDVSSHYVNMSS